MKKYLKMLKQTQLFAGVGEDDIFAMLGCLQAKCVIYKKGEHIFRQGEHLSCIAIVAEGSIHIQKHDYWGNRSIINIVKQHIRITLEPVKCSKISVLLICFSSVLFVCPERIICQDENREILIYGNRVEVLTVQELFLCINSHLTGKITVYFLSIRVI